MTFPCRAVDASIFETARWRFQYAADIPAAGPRTFTEAFEDGHAWPRWFHGIRKVEWTSPRPFGVGTTRTVTLDIVRVEEFFFRWDPGRRFSFHATALNWPMAHVLAEDYLLEPTGPASCRFTYTVAVEPTWFVALGGPLARLPFQRSFKGAVAGLARHMAGQTG